MKVLSGNFSAVYFREEPCYDSHNENKKNRRKRRYSCYDLMLRIIEN